ncbi:MAG: YceI family protein [Methanosarcina sp.]
MTTTKLPSVRIPAGTWTIDPAHSRLGFAAKHLGIATTRGEFREFEGTLEIGGDLESFRAHGSARAASIDTNHEIRDGNLRAAECFDAANHPELRFRSTRIEASDDETLRVVGELEIKGRTHEVELTVELVGSGEGPKGEERLGLEARGTVSRRDYDLRFPMIPGSGDAFVADQVRLELGVAAIRQA